MHIYIYIYSFILRLKFEFIRGRVQEVIPRNGENCLKLQEVNDQPQNISLDSGYMYTTMINNIVLS